MADAVSDLLAQYYGTPDSLGGNIQPRQHRPQPFDMYGEDARQEQLGQHNLIPRIPGGLSALLSMPGQASMDAIDNAQRGRISPQQAAWDFITNGPVGPAGFLRMPSAPMPIRAFHGTHSEVGPDFRFRPHSQEELGPHFGTAEQANSRLADSYNLNGSSVLPVNLRLRNPLEIRDPGMFDPYVLPLELESTGRFTSQEIARLSRHAGGEMEPFWRDVSQLLQRHGYDSIRYRNAHEHPNMNSVRGNEINKLRDHLEQHGDYSYMPIVPNTVYSATTGRQLYGAAAPVAGVSTADILSQYGDGTSQP